MSGECFEVVESLVALFFQVIDVGGPCHVHLKGDS